MSTDASRKARRDVNTQVLKDLEDDVINEIEDFADDKSKPVPVRIHVLGQIKQLVEGVVLTGYSQPAALLSTSVAQLGSSSSSSRTDTAVTDKVAALAQLLNKGPEEALDALITMFGFLNGTPHNEANARLLVMGRVADGSLPVDIRSGQARAELQVTKLTDDLTQANTAKTAITADRDSEKSRADTLQQQLSAVTDPNVATERNNLRQQVARIKAATSEITTNESDKPNPGTRVTKLVKRVVIDPSKLQTEDKTDLGLSTS